MSKTMTKSKKAEIDFPIELVCPTCMESHIGEHKEGCPECVTDFKYTDGFPDLIVGERFDDPFGESCWCYEDESNADLTNNYWLPLFNKHFPDRSKKKPRVLSLGCGTGIDIDILTEQGYDVVGIEIGNRTGAWNKRTNKNRLLLANGMFMPFKDETFDLIYMGCVLPHVGVVGDSFVVKEDYYEIRLKLATEMSRVLKKTGFMAVSSPNGNAPFDLFHDREVGKYMPRINHPGDPVIPTVKDYRKMFIDAGSRKVTTLPSRKYWGFIRSRKSFKGFILSIPVRFLFWFTSIFGFLRGSFIDPWLVVKIEK